MSNLPFHQIPGGSSLSGLVVANGANKATSVKCNFAAVAAPTVGDDANDGYQVFSWWLYNGQIWLCIDPTAGAAAWLPMGLNADYDASPGGTVNAVTASIGITKLIEGTKVRVKMTGGNTAVNPTLNLDGTGANVIPVEAGAWEAGDIITFIYDGTNWQIGGGQNEGRVNWNTLYARI